MTTITVLRPDRPAERDRAGTVVAPAERVTLGDGAVLTVVENGKSSAHRVLGTVAAELCRRLPQISRVEVVQKDSAAKTLTDEEVARIAAGSDLVVTGLGDCGACSSCSTLDAVALEKLGVPATVVISEPFVGLIERFAAMAGMPDYHCLVLPHPVEARDDQALQDLVDGFATELVAQLTPVANGTRPLATRAR